jgi:hypothetical protein
MCNPFPDDLSRVFIQAIHPEFMFLHIIRFIDITVQADFKGFFSFKVDCGCHYQVIVPYHGARMCEAGNGCFPFYIEGTVDTPFFRHY